MKTIVDAAYLKYLKPKSSEDILKDVLKDRSKSVLLFKQICSYMQRGENNTLLELIITSDWFYPSMLENIIFTSACIYNRTKIIKMLFERYPDYDPTYHNFYAFRVAQANYSYDVLCVLENWAKENNIVWLR